MTIYPSAGPHSDYPAQEPWYRRMLGSASLSWQVVIFGGLLNFPQMVLTGGNLGARTVQPGEYPTIAAISAATIVVSFLYGYLGHITVFRNRHIRPVSLATFLVFYALGGLLYSVGIQVSDFVAGSPSEIPFALRAIDAMLVSITWGIGVALVLDGRFRFRSERDALIEDLVAEQERLHHQSDVVQRRQEQLTSALEQSLALHLEEINQAAEQTRLSNQDPQQVRNLAAAIDTAADIGVRQTSHAAWQKALTSASTPRVRRTLRMAVTSPQVWPGPMAVLVAIGVPTVAVRNFGLWWGLPATVGLGLLVWLWMRLVQRLRWSPWACFGVSFLGTAAAVAAFAVLPAPEAPQVAGEAGAIVIALAGGFFLVSFVAALQRERSKTLRAIRDEILLDEATRLAEARAVAALARRLHGPVQSTLRVCAAEIERAAENGDADAVDAAVQAALTALVDATKAPDDLGPTLTDSLIDLCATWKGFMNVDLYIHPDFTDSPARADVTEVVGEALSNSHHHGQATEVRVRIDPEPPGLGVHVSDNGSTEGVGAPGLGTRLLRTLATEYHLDVSPAGATLDVVLPSAIPSTQTAESDRTS